MMRKSPIKTLNVDPGLTTLGWSMIEYDLDTNQKTVVKYGVITGKTLLKNQKEMQAKFAKRYIILWELEPILMDLIKEWQPDYVACESAYAHSFIESYAALVMVIQTLRTAVMRTLNQDIYLIAPREGKKAVSQDGTADKSSVQTAILANPTITIRSSKHNPLDAISEHECDSIAVGVAFIQNQLPSILASKQVTV